MRDDPRGMAREQSRLSSGINPSVLRLFDPRSQALPCRLKPAELPRCDEIGHIQSFGGVVFVFSWITFGLVGCTKDNGYIEGKELDEFFKHLLKQAGECVSDEKVETVKRNLMSIYDESADGRLHLSEVANMLLAEDESFLLIFKRASSLDNSVEFIKIWHQYDLDSSGFISASELKNFLKDLLSHHGRQVEEKKLEEYTDTMMKLFDKNKDGRLDLNDMARILSLKENYLLQFSIEDASQEERRRDFEKIFAHYDVSRTGVLEGPEVDGFVKDMMELVRVRCST